MIAAKIVGKERIEIQNIDKPIIDNYNNVLIKILYCGICGSDMPKYFGNRIKKYPLVIGHEFCGIVEEGPSQLIGSLVSGIPMIYCGKCENCLQGNYQLCSNHKYIGSTLDGAMEEYLVIPEKYVLKINELKDEPQLGALIEPFAVAIHATNLVRYNTLKASIGIIGTGVIATMIYNALRYNLHVPEENIVLVSKEDIPQDNIFDYCYECSGNIGGLNSAIKGTKYRGTIIQLGIIYPEFFNKGISLNFDILLRKEQQLKGCWNSNFKDEWYTAYELISKHRKAFNKIITNTFNLEELEKAFEYKKNNTNATKVLIKVGKDNE